MKYIVRQKYSASEAPDGVTKVGSPKFILSVVFRKTSIADKTQIIKTIYIV